MTTPSGASAPAPSPEPGPGRGALPSRRIGAWGLPRSRAAVMGILNATPDSFSDGGRWMAPERVHDRVRAMLADGADLIDVGAESTRPGAEPVTAAVQLDRLAPVWEIMAEIDVPLSIDTRDATVAEACLERGFEVVNDVSAGATDSRMASVAAAGAAAVVAMHMRGTPRDMDRRTGYGDLVDDVVAEWRHGAARFHAAGVDPARVWFDPGLGFAKTGEQSWDLSRAMPRFRELGVPVVIGASRKRFLGVTGEPAAGRDAATHALMALVAVAGADVVRVHDVAGAAQAVRVAAAYSGGERGAR